MKSGLGSLGVSINNVFGRGGEIAHARNTTLVNLIVGPIEEEGIVEDGS